MRTNLNYGELVPQPFFFQIIILFMHLYTADERLDLISMGPVVLPGDKSDKIQNENFLPTVELEPTTLRFEVRCSTD